MEGCPEAPESENIAPWQRRLTSITQRETESEAAAAAGQILHASAAKTPRCITGPSEAVTSASQLERRDSPPPLTFSVLVQGEEPPLALLSENCGFLNVRIPTGCGGLHS